MKLAQLAIPIVILIFLSGCSGTDTPAKITSTSVENPDGTTTILFSDGTNTTEFPDGSSLTTKTDGTLIEKTSDGITKTTNTDGSIFTVLANGQSSISYPLKWDTQTNWNTATWN